MAKQSRREAMKIVRSADITYTMICYDKRKTGRRNKLYAIFGNPNLRKVVDEMRFALFANKFANVTVNTHYDKRTGYNSIIVYFADEHYTF